MEKVKFDKYDYEVTYIGLLNLQVCSNCPPDEIDKVETAVRLNDPAGTTGNWFVEKDGNLAPVICSNGGRWHYLFSC